MSYQREATIDAYGARRKVLETWSHGTTHVDAVRWLDKGRHFWQVEVYQGSRIQYHSANSPEQALLLFEVLRQDIIVDIAKRALRV